MPSVLKFSCYCLLVCLPNLVMGQIDTALVLPLVELSGTAERGQVTGGRTRSWTKAELQSHSHTNLAEWLSRESGLFIKSYGNGSIATTSIRGGSAAHTSVLWNGLPVQSPMLGQLDFSLFPLGFIDEVQLNYGGNSAAWGSGAIGGVLQLRNAMPPDSTYALGIRSTLGSFGFQDHLLKGHYQSGRWGLQTRLFRRSADNDFSYRLQPDQAYKRQTNAGLQQSGILQSIYFKPRQNQQLKLHLWAQQSDREIPPTTVQTQSLASQADDFIRAALHWKSIGNTTVWQTHLGLFREIIDYRDPQIRLQAKTGFWTLRAEVAGKWAWNERQQLQFGLTHNLISAEAEAYGESRRQDRSAPFLVYHHQLGRWALQFNLRQEIVDGQFQPLVPGLGISGKILHSLSVRAKLSRNYRLPALNDLYWRPGGNPELLPESGWSQEAGLHWEQSQGNHRWSLGVTAFNRHIQNWILWSRPEGQSFWSSNNIAEVWSRGLEYRLQWKWQSDSWSIRLSAGYDQIRSTNEIAINSPKLEKGAQLVYVPEQQAFGQFAWQWRSLRFQYRHTYTGRVQSLNVGLLADYQLGSAGLQYQLQLSPWRGHLFFQANNIWNEHYRVIERQPMPERHFQLGLTVDFQKKLNR